jgi:nucleoside-diphosphate-sugar epimerase
LLAEGLRVIVADVMRPESLRDLPPVDTLLYAVGYDRSSSWSQHETYVEGLRHVLEALPPVGRLIFISSTGVYGQTDGRWVDEMSECVPARAGGQACLDAEHRLRRHPYGDRSVILRMAGLYGPGRVPYLRDMAAGEPLRAATDGYLNLIHIDDAAAAVLAAERHEILPALFVVSDGTPVTRRAYFEQVASLVGVRPRYASPRPGDCRASRSGGSKRVCNRRLLHELKLTLQYSSYREGLAQVLDF